MAEYIDREAAVKAFNNFDAGRADSPPFTLLTPEEFAEYLYELPAADVAPVVHGRWIADGDGYHWTYNCSICAWKDGYPFNERHNFCPHCGAKMQGAGNE